MSKRDSSHAGNKRKRIMQAAIEVFSQKGFFNSKVSEIARIAGVADGTIYIYFKNKDDLLISLFEDRADELVVDTRQKIGQYTNPLDQLKVFIDNHMGLLENEGGLIEVLQVELRQSSKFLKDYKPVKFFEYLDILSNILEEGKATGLFRSDLNVGMSRCMIFGAMDELLGTYILSNRQRHPPSIAAGEVYKLFTEGLLCASPTENADHT